MNYLEPRTDVPAIDDWSTRLILRDTRLPAEQRIHSLIAVLTFVVCFFLPMTPGNVAALVVLAFLLLMTVVGPLIGMAGTRAKRSGLLDGPWRRLPAAVAENDDEPWDVLLADGLVLKGSFHDLPDMVLDRGEVFVCGPDAEGRAMIRAAGFTAMRPAEVGTGEYRAKERLDRPLGRPRDDPAVRQVINATWVFKTTWVMFVVTLVVAGVLVALSVSPLAPTGLVTAALVALPLLDFPMLLASMRRQRRAERAVEHAECWTPVPIRLFPEKAGHHVAGIAELPGGPALVRFPAPVLDVVANIAATSVMWIAGRHENLIAVGVPHVNALTYAVVRPDGAAQDGDPMPWFRRLRSRKPLGLP
ncbi:hypothetical protein [Lentzea flava]|uniref:Uncharacterized protein n=1 Tax=Lentzea flava TaxID=103732 RepID=A0ABQ2U9R7_9PSEU|nr:hypothetical protein [Lentzea flava]MCP2196873.1 hypothetical protein [Lentzea flava]GGU14867.1 hypothetical protein GCM10010178_02930 [Lentzea flava]